MITQRTKATAPQPLVKKFKISNCHQRDYSKGKSQSRLPRSNSPLFLNKENRSHGSPKSIESMNEIKNLYINSLYQDKKIKNSNKSRGIKLYKSKSPVSRNQIVDRPFTARPLNLGISPVNNSGLGGKKMFDFGKYSNSNKNSRKLKPELQKKLSKKNIIIHRNQNEGKSSQLNIKHII